MMFWIVLLLMFITVSGCSILGKPLETPPSETVAIEEAPPLPAKPEVIISTPPPEVEVEVKAETEVAPATTSETVAPLDVAIIISSDIIDNHQLLSDQIGQLITQKGGRSQLFYLYQQDGAVAKVIKQIKQEQYRQVVAIGLEAAKASKLLSQIPTVFCQIYNYQDHDFITDHIKGVSLIPSIDQQFKAWKVILPELRKVGVIVGEGKQPFIEDAILSAAKHDITLISRTVNNDKEMWSEFRRLIPQVDGFWLLPDNRILSKRTLRDMASYSIKHTTPLFTINGLLLQAGAMISAAQVGSDIAAKVVTRLLASTAENTIPGPTIVALEKSHIFINTHAIKRFNLLIPENFMEKNIERWPSARLNATMVQ